ncbi:hypothetical protein [Flavobacterium sp. UBA4854]|uniref:hypothetical protein n=1 Tax=Flavobacterium sp. UBA4854 TaxID=1946548 RepID=UPI00257EDA92|nr:hypothetical protein [Flavobacterium sp. UBA4854]
MTVEDFIEKLEGWINHAVDQDDKYAFQDPAYDLIEEIEDSKEAFDFVEPIFHLIERSPEIDYGAPGPFGSFLEKFYHKGYEEKLIDSLKRQPKEYTVFLLHRLSNDTKNPKVEEYKKILKSFEN